jgi:hypothetical protein
MMLLHLALVMAFRARSGSVDDAGVRSTAAGHRASSTAGRAVTVTCAGSDVRECEARRCLLPRHAAVLASPSFRK